MGGTDAGRLAGGVANRTTLGGAGGAATHTLNAGEMPAHSHGVNDPGHSHQFLHGGSTPAAFTGRAGDGNGLNNYFQSTTGAATGISIQNAGSGGAHNNTQPTLVLNYVIAT
jgi:microcystin-dependent protein